MALAESNIGFAARFRLVHTEEVGVLDAHPGDAVNLDGYTSRARVRAGSVAYDLDDEGGLDTSGAASGVIWLLLSDAEVAALVAEPEQTTWSVRIRRAGRTLFLVDGVVDLSAFEALAADVVVPSPLGDLAARLTVTRDEAAEAISAQGGGGAVSSVFGRTGDVVAAQGDYDSDEVQNLSSVNEPDGTVTAALDALQSQIAGGGAVSSVFGRTGDVVAAQGDYDSDEVQNLSSVNEPDGTVTAALDALQSQIAGVAGGAPTGAVMPFAGSTAPSGWLLCQGQTLSDTAYPALYAVIGDTYNDAAPEAPGDFQLPDLRSRLAVGAGQGTGLGARALGETGGAEAVALVEAELPAHTHQITNVGVVGAAAGSAESVVEKPGPNNLNTSSTGSGEAHENMPPFLVLHYIIKT